MRESAGDWTQGHFGRVQRRDLGRCPGAWM